MNAYRYSYHGQDVTVLAQSNDSDLVQIGDICVRVEKICPLKKVQVGKQSVRISEQSENQAGRRSKPSQSLSVRRASLSLASLNGVRLDTK